jgi:MoxR-vWA-beta-propeller ternary system domain bpX4
MELSNFIQQLLSQGTVSVQSNIIAFDPADEKEVLKILQRYYTEDILEMPETAPAFNEAAALWAAKYFYVAVQLTVLRDEGEAIINEKLQLFTETITADAVYSADLILRYLPALLQLAKGLSPADILVKVLEQTAAEWPFSSTGIEVGAIKNEDIIFTHPSLTITYTDRLITAKDIKRISGNQLQQHILSATGLHLKTFWPQAATFLKNDI